MILSSAGKPRPISIYRASIVLHGKNIISAVLCDEYDKFLRQVGFNQLAVCSDSEIIMILLKNYYIMIMLDMYTVDMLLVLTC